MPNWAARSIARQELTEHTIGGDYFLTTLHIVAEAPRMYVRAVLPRRYNALHPHQHGKHTNENEDNQHGRNKRM